MVLYPPPLNPQLQFRLCCLISRHDNVSPILRGCAGMGQQAQTQGQPKTSQCHPGESQLGARATEMDQHPSDADRWISIHLWD